MCPKGLCEDRVSSVRGTVFVSVPDSILRFFFLNLEHPSASWLGPPPFYAHLSPFLQDPSYFTSVLACMWTTRALTHTQACRNPSAPFIPFTAAL